MYENVTKSRGTFVSGVGLKGTAPDVGQLVGRIVQRMAFLQGFLVARVTANEMQGLVFRVRYLEECDRVNKMNRLVNELIR